MDALGADGEVTAEEVNNLADALAEDGKLTSEEKEVIAGALIEAAVDGVVSGEAMKEAGLAYEDLPPETPVDVRTDESGNAVVIEAEVAAALELFSEPTELVSAIFSDPGEALLALASLGADMSPEEREEAEKMVVTVVVVGQAVQTALGAAAAAAQTAASVSTGSTSSRGPRRARAVRRRSKE